jgi:hypothetical protein
LAREILGSPEKNPSGIYMGGAEHRPPRLTGRRAGVSAAPVSRPQVVLEPAHPRVVGSFGNAAGLAALAPEDLREACDLAEIRLDLLDAEGVAPGARPWARLGDFPLLFTARRGDEGGAPGWGTEHVR